MTHRSDGQSFNYRDPCTGAGVAVDPDEIDDGGRVDCPVCGRSTKVSPTTGLLRFHRVPEPERADVPSLREIALMSREELRAIAPIPCLCGCGRILAPHRYAFATNDCIERWQSRDGRRRSLRAVS